MNRRNYERNLELFISPHDGSNLELDATQGQLRDGSGIHYPFLSEIPFLLPEPSLNLHEWISRFSALLTASKRDLDLLASIKDLDDKIAIKSSRLQQISAANLVNLNTLIHLFQDMGIQQESAKIYEAFSLKISSRQNLLSYGENIFRDWVWGASEIESDLRHAERLLSGRAYEKILTLGAGAGRFSVELHRQLKPALSVITDINPLFLFLLNKILAGETVKFDEKSFAPAHQ